MAEKTHTYLDGREYVGEFKNDLFHGQGTKTYADGRQMEGSWKKGEFLR